MTRRRRARCGRRSPFASESLWNAAGNDPAFLHQVISGVGSPRLGNTIDTANFYWSGKPLSAVHGIVRLSPAISSRV